MIQSPLCSLLLVYDQTPWFLILNVAIVISTAVAFTEPCEFYGFFCFMFYNNKLTQNCSKFVSVSNFKK